MPHNTSGDAPPPAAAHADARERGDRAGWKLAAVAPRTSRARFYRSLSCPERVMTRMTRRTSVWLVPALIFLGVNVFGAVSAGMDGELPHAGLHLVVALLAVYLVWRLARPHTPPRFGLSRAREDPGAGAAFADRLVGIEQAVDAVALEVERIGEGQRFLTRVAAERALPQPDLPAARGRVVTPH
ncbi:hypothetical protein tb265_00320 [Gemmatimonadetes bacterium T265]|nr:hypothetical protein tb265_00320 [Gemmatimonadetes bacterium T265]